MARTESRLGKGLGALLGEYLDTEGADAPLRQIDVSRVRPNPYQPRAEFPPSSLEELIESIRENGLLQPLVVRSAPGEGWEIVAGERRWRAVQQLGWSEVPAIVRELRDEQMLVLALVENLQREALSAIEEAIGYQRLVDGFGLTQQEVAERVGRDRSTVSNALRLLTLPPAVRELLAGGQLTAGHARAILGAGDETEQIKLAREVVRHGLSVRETERRVRKARAAGDGGSEDGRGRARAAGGAADAVARRAETLLSRRLGTRVGIRLRSATAGEIRIDFHDAEDFERLVLRLLGDEAGELFGEA
ncbi:MAG: ParB/RepB/Spo0J family partition protein [Gemmatimonadota bacterium]